MSYYTPSYTISKISKITRFLLVFKTNLKGYFMASVFNIKITGGESNEE